MKKDGVKRVGGRNSLAPVTADTKNPMILQNDYHVMTILTRNIQVKGHCGIKGTINSIRAIENLLPGGSFWTISGEARKRTCI